MLKKNTADFFTPQIDLQKDKRIYTVSQITQDIKLILENTFAKIWIEGEISNFRIAASGHFYFTLKDEKSVLAAAMFTRANKDLKFRIEDGMRVICFGAIEAYGPRSQYQIIVDKIEPKGIGAQQLALEQLKNKLSKEGLFDAAHKRPLPLMPFRIGIVTSSAGAVVRDILQILRKGAGCADVIIRSVRVQGKSSGQEIAAAIKDLNQFGQADVIIICRGGGSTEDLNSFNEEAVARAIYNSVIPTVSAVGHQINVTLADLVADAFVETPTAAAKIIADKKNALLTQIGYHQHRLTSSLSELIYRLHNSLTAAQHMLKSPLDRLLEQQQWLDELSMGLASNTRHYVSITQERLRVLSETLAALNPLAILSRGYSLSIRLRGGIIIQDTVSLQPGDAVKTILAKGSFLSTVQEVFKDDVP